MAHDHVYEDHGPLPESGRFRVLGCVVLIPPNPWDVRVEHGPGVKPDDVPAAPCGARVYRCRCCGTDLTIDHLVRLGVVPKPEEKPR